MIVKELSEFIVNLKYDDIPEIAIEKAKLCFLDFLGVTYRGSNEKSSKIAIKTINHLFNSNCHENDQLTSIIGHGRFNLLNAGFINGISSHCLDLDDGHRIAQLHPGTVVFPSSLAISEQLNLDGYEFLESVICGYEIAIVLGILANPHHRNQGFHSTGTIGIFAAGATAAKALNLDLNQTITTLGICGTQSSGLLESNHQGTMGKSLHSGKSVYNGILSAYLVKNGFSGAESIVDGDEGFLKAMSTKSYNEIQNKLNNDKNYLKNFLRSEIGKFHINDVYFKKYPYCRHLHSSIDSVLDINKEIQNKEIDIEDIEKIIVKTYKIATEHDNFYPKNKEDLKQSLPYAVAIAILYDDLSIETINNINFNDYKLKNILNKIVIEIDVELNSLTPNYRPSKIIFEIKNKENDIINEKSLNNNLNNEENLFYNEENLLERHNFNNDKNLIYTKKNVLKKNNLDNEGNIIIESLNYLPLGEVETPFSKEDLLKKFKQLNPDFDCNKLDHIDDLESFKIKDFIHILFGY